MGWNIGTACSVTIPHEAVDAVSNFLLELGATGIVEGDRDPATPLPPTATVQAYFPDETPGPDVYAALERYLRQRASLFPDLNTHNQPSLQLSQINSAAWHEQWRGHFPPIQVGFSFLILPPWETRPTRTDRKVIVIDPSMAFGTGHHPTTQGCLEAIEALGVAYGPPQRALDVGTGSGILAIALAQLGCSDVWAIDTDPIALDETRKNLGHKRYQLGHSSQSRNDRVTAWSVPTPGCQFVCKNLDRLSLDAGPELSHLGATLFCQVFRSSKQLKYKQRSLLRHGRRSLALTGRNGSLWCIDGADAASNVSHALCTVKRFFIRSAHIHNSQAVVSGSEFHHLHHVLRLQTGERVVLRDENGDGIPRPDHTLLFGHG